MTSETGEHRGSPERGDVGHPGKRVATVGRSVAAGGLSRLGLAR
jgi:hypothetical protein